MKKLLFFGLVAGGAGYFTYVNWPGIQRYIKIKQMAS
jgi:hypothetical protein